MFSLRAARSSLVAIASLASTTAGAATFVDPPVFTSAGGVLSVMLVAAEHAQPGLVGPDGADYSAAKFWTYQVCALPNPTTPPAGTVPSCPAGTPSYSNLGSVRFALTAGDVFKVRLVNQLPPVNKNVLTHYSDYPPLAFNPTNIHTHGFIVDPYNPGPGSLTPYGDYVLLELPPANVTYTTTKPHGTIITNNYVDYNYILEADHPSGLFWLHPHLHGISLNQVSAGLGDIMTVGKATDYCETGNNACVSAIQAANKHFIVLKDTQLVTTKASATNYSLYVQPIPTFCGTVTNAAANLGSCPAVSAPGTPLPAGSAWLHTVSGQIYPTINVGANGDVWEIVNGSGSRDYLLALGDPNGSTLATQTTPIQVLAIDGVTIKIKAGETPAVVSQLVATRLDTVPCPGSTITSDEPVCATRIRMMPSSRVAVRVIRNDGGTGTASKMLYTSLYNTGLNDFSTGDQWPAAVNLTAKPVAAVTAVATADVTTATVGTSGQLQAAPVVRQPGTTTLVSASSASAVNSPMVAAGGSNCTPVPAGGMRRITFGFPTDPTFGVGEEILDASGTVISSTPIRAFDINRIDVCVPVSKGGQTYEVWELDNVTPEDHNFHIHQTRFFTIAGAVAPGYSLPQILNGDLVLQDNVPMPHAANSPAGCSGVVAPTGTTANPNPPPNLCNPHKTYVVIPFHEVGDYVFHCHILEHEDGGMMARIHVQASLP